MAYPAALTDHFGNYAWTDGISIPEATPHNIHLNAIDALEEKVGVDSSAVTTSHDYKLAHEGIVQIVNTQDGDVASGTTAIGVDNSIPQNTEGTEYMTLAITPKSATNKLKIDVVCHLTCNGADHLVAALFQDSTAGALAATMQYGHGGAMQTLRFTHFMTAGTTSPTTFKVRAGNSDATSCTFNGINTSRYLGGVMASSITISEIKV